MGSVVLVFKGVLLWVLVDMIGGYDIVCVVVMECER